MGFLRPKTPSVQAPPPPVVEDTDATKQDYADSLRRRRGRAASILTTKAEASQPVNTAAKTLLGS